MENLKHCSTCAYNGTHQTETCLWCVNHNHDQYVPKPIFCKEDCKYFGLRTTEKPCADCKALCNYTPVRQASNKKKYGVGELPYLGGPLEWVHLFDSKDDADAYYNLVVNSCTKSKINVRIVKFTVDEEIKLKDGQKVED